MLITAVTINIVTALRAISIPGENLTGSSRIFRDLQRPAKVKDKDLQRNLIGSLQILQLRFLQILVIDKEHAKIIQRS